MYVCIYIMSRPHTLSTHAQEFKKGEEEKERKGSGKPSRQMECERGRISRRNETAILISV